MNIDMNVNPSSSVLLLLDVQVGIVNMLPPSEQEKILGNLARATMAARTANLPVIYVMVGYRPNYPEVSARNSQVSRVKKEGRLLERAADALICPEIDVRPEDVIVTKKRGSAFFGTDLEIILRAANIDTLILAGISSLMTVESTARDAFDRDYRLFVLGDCCADGDVKANEVALTILLPRVSTVCTTDQFCNDLERKNE
jgi:nicotinamidase-related amidase